MESMMGTGSLIFDIIWIATSIIATIYCITAWLWNENPNGDHLAWIWMAAIMLPFTIVIVGMIGMMAAPVVLLAQARKYVQYKKLDTNSYNQRINGN